MPRQTTRKPTGDPTAQKATPRRSVKKLRTLTLPTEEQIRARAYQIYLARNGGPGDPHEDWCQAERELTQELNQ